MLRLQTGVHAGRVQRPVRGQFEEAHNQEAEEKRESQNALRQPTEPGHPAAFKRRLRVFYGVCETWTSKGGVAHLSSKRRASRIASAPLAEPIKSRSSALKV